MKVCHFCSTEIDAPYFSYLGKFLPENGSKPFFVTLNTAEAPKWLVDAPAVEYVSLKVGSRLLYPLAVWRLSRFLKQNKIDLIQTHLFDAAFLGLAAAWLAGTRAKIVSRHHLDDGALTGTGFHVALDKWTNQNADLVVVPSEATRRYMLEVENQTGENVRVVPYGFDFTVLDATDNDRLRVRAEFGLEDNFVIGCVGRFVPGKGHRYLFEAVKEIKKGLPNVRVLLLGSGDRQMLEESIAELGLGENVIFAGYRRDVPACMKAMDLLVHPSLSESFGQVIVEAMCVGTPVVVTAVGGVPEIVTNGETGIVVEPKDSGAIHRAIQDLVSQPDLRMKYAENGKKSVYEKFNVKRFIERQSECYNELLSQE